MQREFLNEYFILVEELLDLHVQKENYLEKVIENYGSHKADAFLKKIEEVEVIISRKNLKFANIEQQRRELKG